MVPGRETNPEDVAKVMDEGGFALYISTGERPFSSLIVRPRAAANIYLNIQIRNGKEVVVKGELFISTHFYE